ncbi:hypothetical protein PZE06_07580 [Robertmurraya sp. DFI.2.37]|uniref:hypothetical protein n=1 Tax=Robertmurraya sp. DFI.2.37 TaxID=3031819 RepID=UPI001246ED74|nr:hypothetical protein [Robertmurraya sp. DFI.2.37]MDF1508042.1 hypothetical protein [Robertmurraya sp. DFI.2.37]
MPIAKKKLYQKDVKNDFLIAASSFVWTLGYYWLSSTGAVALLKRLSIMSTDELFEGSSFTFSYCLK